MRNVHLGEFHIHYANALRRARLFRIRRASSEEFVKDNAKRIDVGGSSNGFASNLLRAGVFGSHRAKSRGLLSYGRVDDFGDAKIEQLGNAVRCHEDVAGLEVAMNDESLVRVLHGAANLQEELQPPGDVQIVLFAVLINGSSF